ncbi:CBS domain-containing protein [Propylenella binzhouense]|uniref:CBS domain-containing protein n=1 Tax=Propylenella binzhouense TaxID=2555902 RepID=A0A964WSY7_9HYPH|nr:CBS domain-containing protein [Propylenella binzhouense]MYZ47464.1 CBS domain-containing protein [Propylenella binzhouense]
MNVAEILSAKGSAVVTVRPEQTIEMVVHRLRMEKIGAVIVSSDGNSIDGILSERDIAWGLTDHGAELMHKPVGELMTKSVITCSPDDHVAQIARVMTQRRIRHLPVVEHGRLIGIVSVGDVVKHRLAELELEANVLRDYAVSRR